MQMRLFPFLQVNYKNQCSLVSWRYFESSKSSTNKKIPDQKFKEHDIANQGFISSSFEFEQSQFHVGVISLISILKSYVVGRK